jgi:L-aminopeptidase/D-esterase-like protein
VFAALANLGPAVAEGSLGAGTGMVLFDFPGGIGTASRVVGEHHVGVLLLCNFGDRDYLDVPGLEFGPPVAAGQSRLDQVVGMPQRLVSWSHDRNPACPARPRPLEDDLAR